MCTILQLFFNLKSVEIQLSGKSVIRIEKKSALLVLQYLVDPASSHMLVLRIKPCMSQYKRFCTVKLRMAHYNSYSLFDRAVLRG